MIIVNLGTYLFISNAQFTLQCTFTPNSIFWLLHQFITPIRSPLSILEPIYLKVLLKIIYNVLLHRFISLFSLLHRFTKPISILFYSFWQLSIYYNCSKHFKVYFLHRFLYVHVYSLILGVVTIMSHYAMQCAHGYHFVDTLHCVHTVFLYWCVIQCEHSICLDHTVICTHCVTGVFIVVHQVRKWCENIVYSWIPSKYKLCSYFGTYSKCHSMS